MDTTSTFDLPVPEAGDHHNHFYFHYFLILPVLASLLQYGVILGHAAKKRLRIYRADKYGVLSIHIVVGLCEIFRLHYKQMAYTRKHGTATAIVLATPFDLFLACIQSITNLALVRPLQRGDPMFTRPCYQAPALLRMVMSAWALYTQDPDWHQTSISTLSSFLWARLLIWMYKGYLRRGSELYNMAVFGSAIMALSGSKHPYLTTRVYVVGVALNAYLNRWTTNKLRSADELGHHMCWFLETLDTLGFAELENGRNAGKYDVALNPADDIYTFTAPEKAVSLPAEAAASVQFASLKMAEGMTPGSPAVPRRREERIRKRVGSSSYRASKCGLSKRPAEMRKTVRPSI